MSVSSDDIIVDLVFSDELYRTYGEVQQGVSFEGRFKFDTTRDIEDNLNELSKFALKVDNTLPVYYSYNSIFLDVISRWICQYKTYENPSNYKIIGSEVLFALGRLVGICQSSLNLTEYFINEINFFEILKVRLSEIEAHELQQILLAFFRLIRLEPSRFKQFILPEVLYEIINTSKSPVCQYLSIQILKIYLDASESDMKTMIQNMIQDDIYSFYETDKQVNYKFLLLLELKRLSNFSKLRKITNQDPSNQIIHIKLENLSSLVTSICGVLIPQISSVDTSQNNFDSSNFVSTFGSVTVLQKLAQNIQKNKPVMLYGRAGSGKTFLINQLAKYMHYENSIVKIHLGEQTDSKLLLGTYTSGEKPGTFKWRSGVLTTAVQEGKWVVIEDIDKAPTEVLSVLLTLLEKRELSIPSRGEIIKAKNGFQLISTVRILSDDQSTPELIGSRLWNTIKVEVPGNNDLKNILIANFPLLTKLIGSFIKCYEEILKIYSLNSFISKNNGSHPRVISFRDLMKFSSRCNRMLVNNGITSSGQLLDSTIYDNIFAEAVDCFGSALTSYSALEPLIKVIGTALEIPTSRVDLFVNKNVPNFINDDDSLRIGRAKIMKSSVDNALYKHQTNNSFARTNHSLKLMEQIGVAVQMVEPILLVGETGTGKTTVVQQMAKLLNKKITVINVSQQTEVSDLLGGYKPINTKLLAIPIQEIFDNLFVATFSKSKNEKFFKYLATRFNKNQWKKVIKLWKDSFQLAKDLLSKPEQDSDEEGGAKKKRKLKMNEKGILLDKWLEFNAKVEDFEVHALSLDNSFIFNFVEGSLVKAVREGEWLLLDEINLASSDTLESISDLLVSTISQRSILLTEKGDIESIKAHQDFRIFGCMNPSTDVGKKDLPLSIRSRFSEIYVHSPDRDLHDLLLIIEKYIGRFAVSDYEVIHDVAQFYLEAKKMSESNEIVDGANQRPHFSIRTLTRTLVYVSDIVGIYGLRRSLYEGFSMSFLTLLDMKSEALLKPIIEKYTIAKLKNPKSVMNQCPPIPSTDSDKYVQFRHYWMRRGPGEIIPQENYIITPFVEHNLLNLVRATSGRRFPVLVQGPTSAGKTSMIHYLANITGHKFVRINNHEHTDLQEYLGTYISDSNGKLVFQEGVLVRALREGHWIVLDELNLAPTDVLEALNRLLDDNRELFIPETQEVVHPHPDFMLFATQNPPGLYGGRKILSRAFRNRFLELHFDDIPQDELEIILRERCKIAPTYGKKIVEVYKQLSVQRQSTRLFEQKNSFATLRDLFRWALRDAVGYEELAANGYMLLAERVRKNDEKLIVKQVIEDVMRVKLDMDLYYENLENKALMSMNSNIVWTKAMRRLAVLVFTSMKYNEPLLLVGETGCGKTTVCQIIAQYLGKELVSVNAHQNTETGDILGAQRPVRNRFEVQRRLIRNLTNFFNIIGSNILIEDYKVDGLLKLFDSVESFDGVDEQLIQAIEDDRKSMSVIFEWSDGPLIQAMKSGNIFLLDEISLADDSVLERLNSVLEPERSLYLAEKGTDDAFITAAESFEFLATMNPGGDYGKKELSPALRNRFTEIWVPSMEDFNDVREIVSARLNPKYVSLVDAIVEFSEWYGKTYGGGNAQSGVISLRDILSWVDFINSSSDKVNLGAALLHGAAMVFVDALGTNNTAYLAENENQLKEQKYLCIKKLSEFSKYLLMELYNSDVQVVLKDDSLVAGLFEIPYKSKEAGQDSFNLHAPTTAMNTMRVIRALQVHKPILLEGSPGVGKTSLISAIAKSTGNKLIRINLSEQTDLVDLFGSDAPAEGGNTGEFVWRDAPFLRAMQKGEWVLLDEMNLASQSVLEGLNACLDHRGETYIPELDKTFNCHPDFKVFAAQNPQYQGGGRKGLPKSFVNRFSVVYVETLNSDDLNLISQHLFPNVPKDTIAKMIMFIHSLEKEVVIEKIWGTTGGSWEFNLRDTLRWLELYSSRYITENLSPSDFVDTIICQRFRTPQDRAKAVQLFESIFGPMVKRDNFYSISEQYVQVGGSIIKRKDHIQYSFGNSVPLECNFSFVESMIRSINHNLPVILVGPSNGGKTELIRFIANIVGAKVDEFAMNSEVDSMDILGGYEQVDLTRAISNLCATLYDVLNNIVVQNLTFKSSNSVVLKQSLEFLRFIKFESITSLNYTTFHKILENYISVYVNDSLQELFDQSVVLNTRINLEKSVKFEWFDGLLVKAVENGNWLILDNANLCNPSVLDRLNSLLEMGGQLIINECNSANGEPRVVEPHPNFRLFLTMDPKYGELSRAMRNRGVEMFVDSLVDRVTQFDAKTLGIDNSNHNQIESIIKKPTSSFLTANESTIRPFCLLEDILGDESPKDELCNVGLGLLPFSSINDANCWVEVIQNSSLFDSHSTTMAMQIKLRLELMTSNGSLSSLFQVFNHVWSSVPDLFYKDLNLEIHQSLHPLWNSYVSASFERLVPFSNSNEATMFFELLSNLASANSTILTMEYNAMNGKVGDLTYIEKSVAYSLGRNIRKQPRLDIYGFVKSILDFIRLVFIDSLKNMFSMKDTYGGIVELQIIWKNLVSTASEQHESKLRVYQNLVRAWLEKFSHNSFINSNSSKLVEAIDLFGSAMILSTGSSMSILWECFRDNYPITEKSWSNAKSLFELAAEFDDVIKAQFDDSNEFVKDIRNLMLSVYGGIVAGDFDENDFENLCLNLSSGISRLREVSSKFIFKRENDFINEFTYLTNFVVSKSYLTKNFEFDKIITLSTNSNISTMSLLRMLRKEEFKPYPRVLNNLWIHENGKFLSKVSGLFFNDVIVDTLDKIENFNLTKGYLVDQKLLDMKKFGTELITNSQAVLLNQRTLFCQILFDWFKKILSAHMKTFDQNSVSELNNLLSNELELDKFELSNFVRIIQNSNDLNFIRVSEKYILPSLYLLSNEKNCETIGKAWVLFACGLVQLYVPDKPHDPAIEEHIIYKKLQDQKSNFDNIIEAWKMSRMVVSGDFEVHAERFNIKMNSSEKPRVFRPTQSIDGLFEEWKAFMESTIDANSIQNLLSAVDDNTDDSLKRLDMFQENSTQFLVRMDRNYLTFSDLNDILKGYVSAMKLGFDLIMLSHKGKVGSSFSNLWSIDIIELANEKSILNVFPAAKELSKGLGVDAPASELLMLFFIYLCFAHGLETGSPTADVFHESLQMLYYRWTLRRMKEEEENAQKDNWFKYQDPDEDIEGDFKEMFPDHDDIIDVDQRFSRKNESFQDIYYEISKLYIEAFTDKKEIHVSKLVEQGSTLSSMLKNVAASVCTSENNSSVLSSLIWKLSTTYRETQHNNEEIDFYRGSSPFESKKGVAIISDIYTSVAKLLESWPEHATLQNISKACLEYLQYSLQCPIARCLQKIEQIYNFISEWEKYASTQVSLKTHFVSLTKLIISWRKLELSTWKSLFAHEELALQKNIGKWWFYLFETILIPLLTDNIDGEEDNESKLLSALNIFLGKTTYGEFLVRLDLLRAFNNHVYLLYPNSTMFNALSNFITFYEQFRSTIDETILTSKKKLEKDINEVILLASWKDVNIDALKQSSRRSHSKLYKIVRKYRALLAVSITSIIEGGISNEKKVNYELEEIEGLKKHTYPPASISLVSSISTWSERPKRLQDMTLINKNMEIYVDRLTNESNPNLLEFAQELQVHMERLKNETPKVFKDENKKIIAALKNQKRMLLSDTIKELRRIGLKTQQRADILKLQSSVNLILKNCQNFVHTKLDGSDAYFYRVIEILPRLRYAVSTVSPDVPQVDIEKGMAATESLIHSLIVTRNPLRSFAIEHSQLNEHLSHLEEVAEIRSTDATIVGVTMLESANLNLKTITKLSIWLSKLLEFALETLQCDFFGKSISLDVFIKAKTCIMDFDNEMKVFKDSVITNRTVVFIEKFRAFLESFYGNLVSWKAENPSASFVADALLNWMNNAQDVSVESSTSLSTIGNLEAVEVALRLLSSSILIVVQKTMQLQDGEIHSEDEKWLVLTQRRLFDYAKSINCKRINEKLANCINLLHLIEFNRESCTLISALVAFTLPLLQNYYRMASTIFEKLRKNYIETSRATYIMSVTLHSLATNGFCSPEPPSEEKQDNNLHDGTGLGDGDGQNNHSNDVGDDEDMSEQAQQPNEKNKDEESDGENDDAVDVDGDMAGDLEETSDQEMSDQDDDDKDENEDLDEEVDDIDDLDPNAVDEKMWDEEAKEDNNEKESDKIPENANNEDEMEANENEADQKKDPQESDNKSDPQDDENEQNEEDENADEEDDVGEQEDEVKNKENDQLEENVPENDALELPENLDLDGDEDDDEKEEEDAGLDDMDKEVDAESDENVDDGGEDIDAEAEAEAENEADSAENQDTELENENDGVENELDDEENDDVDTNADPEIDEDVNMSDEEALNDEDDNQEDDNANKKPDLEQETADGVDGANYENMDEESNMESAVKQEVGEKGEGADNQVMEENDDIGATGGASADPQQQDQNESSNQDEARDEARESMKQLGDSMKEFHRRRQEINEAKLEKEEITEEAANERPDEFEHIDGENTDFDTQALGAADKDQIQSIDDENAIDDDMDLEINETEIKEEKNLPAPVTENEEDSPMKEEDTCDKEDFDSESKNKTGMGEKKLADQEDEDFALSNDINEIDLSDEEEEMELDGEINKIYDEPPIDAEEARELWRKSEYATQELASGLCEQLRLILEPTLATKLKGDYKTGKRLNMKRIIPYIASEFRKDKIWLRRTKPSKRQFQIMIAVDDSKSMKESKATELAFHSIALVSKALTQLESGGLSIVRFGEDVKVVHPFEKQFNNQVSGTEIFQWFDFQQTKTDILKLCKNSLEIFKNAKLSSNSDLWQLQIILSDGVCEDHATIQRLVRKAREERIMMVFVVIDGINSNESILDMSQVNYTPDPITGSMKLKVDKYLDTFPFEYYVVVRNIKELPEMLALILRQYFSEVANNQ